MYQLSQWMRSAVVAIALFPIVVVAQAQSYPPAWSKTATYAAGDEVQLNGNIVRALKPVTVAGKYVYANWELVEVLANTTVLIGAGQTFTTLPAAWTYIQNARVADGVFLHLYISSQHGDFEEPFSGSFSLNHASGARISLIGDSMINDSLGGGGAFPHDGLTIDSGHTFGSVSGLTIFGTQNGQGNGVKATGNSTISLSNVQVVSFDTSVYAGNGGLVYADDQCVFGLADTYVIEATTHGTVDLSQGITISNSGGDALLYAEDNGVINAPNAILNGVNGNVVGARADTGAVIELPSANITNCAYGAEAEDHGYVRVYGFTFSGNGTDLVAFDGGVVEDDAVLGTPTTKTDSGFGSIIY